MDIQTLRKLLADLLVSRELETFSAQQAELLANLEESWQAFSQKTPRGENLDLCATEAPQEIHALNYKNEALNSDFVMNTDTVSADVDIQALNTVSADIDIQTLNAQSADADIQALNAASADANTQALNAVSANADIQALNTVSADADIQALNTVSADVDIQALNTASADANIQALNTVSADANIQALNTVSADVDIQALNTASADADTQALNTTFEMSLSASKHSAVSSALLGDTAHQNQANAMPIYQPNPIQFPSPATPSAQIPPLPNAQQGKPYHAPLDKRVIAVRFVPDCGLIWDSEQRCIHGTPNTNGDIKLFLQLDNQQQITQALYINADPQSLWKNLPSDSADKFYKPDEQHEFSSTPFARLLAARVRGRSHAHIGSFCDDDFAIRYFPTGDVHLLCVSDGAGSAKFSRYGSQLAVNAVAKKIAALLNDPAQNYHRLPEMDNQQRKITAEALIKAAAHQALAAHYQAQDEDISLKSLSCTLLIALTLPLRDGQWFSISYWVGDGAIGIYAPEENTIVLMGEADSGQYSGETRFLSNEDVADGAMQNRIRHHTSATAPLLILMTDGVSDPKFETEAQLNNPNKWQALWQELQAVINAADSSAALQDWLQFWSAGNHDDRTLALLIPNTTTTGAQA